MFDGGNDGENGERQVCSLALLEVFEQQEKAVQLLSDERERLLDIEEKLWFMIFEDIKYRIRKNQELRLEVEKQKQNCMELAKGLNASIISDCYMAFG